ncbi:MAG: LCP family protein [Anaerolineae bacterium]|nr:LCP family protein [Anaerolineae bacterium]
MRPGKMLHRFFVLVAALLVVLSVFIYVVYAANGILDETEARDTRRQHDSVIVGTATALNDRLVLLSGADSTPTGVDMSSDTSGYFDTAVTTVDDLETGVPLVEPEGSLEVAAVQESSTPTVVIVSDTPAPSDTPLPSNTPEPTAVAQLPDTDTPVPTEPPAPTEPIATVTLIPTNTPRVTATLIPTNTPRPSATPTNTATFTPSPTLTPSFTPTFTLTPTPTFTFTPSPTYTPSLTPTPTYVIQGTYAVPLQTPVVDLPLRVPLIEDNDDIINFLLLGSDTTSSALGQTDVIIVVSVNKEAGSVAMWHLPRDLFVYIPNYTMDRINRAFALGEMNDYPGGGFGLMKETFLYNFGIEIDHYARVDFSDYMEIVHQLGGLEVSIDCSIRDWRLIDPDLDPTLEESWEIYTMPLGRQKLTPYMALWYVRSRKTTNDLDRGRRQMDALRAMWYQAREQGLFTQVTQLWPEAVQVVETDMSLTDVLAFVPLAVSLDIGNIARYSGMRDEHYIPFLTPDDGRDVTLPNREKLISLIQDFLTPPTSNRVSRQDVSIAIVDASYYNIGFDLVAADRLAWEGYSAQALGTPPDTVRRELTIIYDYTGQTKGSALEDLMRVLRVTDGQVISEPDPNRTVDFRVEIGTAYNSCIYGNAEDELEIGPPVIE